MARLNDLATPVESIEALKRRFIRQNREIARANSIQSLRIQALESEISRLLCENASLHEQVISLNHEIERYESAKALSDGVHNLKQRLDSKLAELGNLVIELGALPRKIERKSESEAAILGVDEERQSQATHRRTELGPEATSSFDDGRLPVILEDKYYPRKTLEPEELEDMVNDVPGSPELGPPPVAHLDPEDSPVREEWTEPFEYAKQNSTESRNDYKGSLYSQEPRKRGRPRLVPAPIKTDKDKAASSVPLEESKSNLKSGHKRKFDAGEEDESYFIHASEMEDDFKFSRTDHTSDKVLGGATTESLQSDAGQTDTQELKSKVRIRRKVLEPKNTNMNSMSPRKHSISAIENEKSRQKPDRLPEVGRKIDPLSKSRRTRNDDENCVPENYKPHKGKNENANIHIIKDGKAEPTSHTPAKFISPQDQNASATTPGELGGTSRSTRRPRNIVSYVEPNLKAKMRRPTKEFVDAIAEDRFRRTSNPQIEKGSAGHGEERCVSTAGIEAEGSIAVNFVNSKHEALQRKSSNGQLPETVISGSKLPDLPVDSAPELQEPGSPTPGERVQTSIPGNRKGSDRRRRTVRGESLSNSVLEKKDNAAEDEPQPELDIDSASATSTGKGSSTVTRQSRRHSSNPAGYRARSGRDSSPHRTAEYLASTHTLETRSQRGRRRGENTNETLEEDNVQISRRQEDSRESFERDNIDSSTIKATIDTSDRVVTEAELLRRVRVSARRRSMMF